MDIEECYKIFYKNQALIKLGYMKPTDQTLSDLEAYCRILKVELDKVNNILDEVIAKCEVDLQLKKMKGDV